MKPSRAVSANYGVACPTCHVPADQPCRTRQSCRVTDTHLPRIAAAFMQRSKDTK